MALRAPYRGDLPPGPRAPTAVQSLWWALRPESFLLDCRRRFGDTFTVRLTQGGRWVLLSHPDDAATVFTHGSSSLLSGSTHELLEPLFGRHSVHQLDGPEHQRQRRLLMPPLHGDHLQRYERIIATIAGDQVRGWPTGTEFAVLPRAQKITLEVIVRGLFGFTGATEGVEVRRRLDEVLRLTMAPLGVVAGAIVDIRLLRLGAGSRLFAFRRAMDALEAALFAEIERRRSRPEPEREDMLSLLLQAEDDLGRPLDDEELKDNLITLVVAGHETSATALAWAFHFLARSPETLAELDRVEDEVWLEAVVRETLRLRPPVPLAMRRSTQPLQLRATTLPMGVNFAVCIPLLHRSPAAYREPDEFRPTRFRDGGPEERAWAPFGGGNRRCLGSRLAMLELKVVLRTILRERRPVLERRRSEAASSLAMRPARGGRITLRKVR